LSVVLHGRLASFAASLCIVRSVDPSVALAEISAGTLIIQGDVGARVVVSANGSKASVSVE
jgi:hypothetical protein